MLFNTFTTVTTTFTTISSVIGRVLGANDWSMGMHPRHLSRSAAAQAAAKARKPWQASKDAKDGPDADYARAYSSECRSERTLGLPVVVPVVLQTVVGLQGVSEWVSSGRASALAS